jgi:hypothetical protein
MCTYVCTFSTVKLGNVCFRFFKYCQSTPYTNFEHKTFSLVHAFPRYVCRMYILPMIKILGDIFLTYVIGKFVRDSTYEVIQKKRFPHILRNA